MFSNRVLNILALTLFTLSCTRRVIIPADGDQPPIVSISNNVQGMTGTVSQTSETESGQIKVSVGTELAIVSAAENFGAVQSFVLDIKRSGSVLYHLEKSVVAVGSPPQGPETLFFLGTTDPSDPSFMPIRVVMNGDPITVTATALNFHNMPRSITVVFATSCPPCPPNEVTDESTCACSCPWRPDAAITADGQCGTWCCGLNEHCCNGQCVPFGQPCCAPGTSCPAGYHCDGSGQVVTTCCPNGTTYGPLGCWIGPGP